MRFLLAALLTLGLGTLPVRADQVLPPGQIDSNGFITFRGGPTLGLWQSGKYTATPNALTLPATDQGSTGNLSGMSVQPWGFAAAQPLGRLLAGRATAYQAIPSGLLAAIANGTSATDVTTYLQQTLDAVEAAGGGEVYFPQGRYTVCGLSIGTNVTLASYRFGATLAETTGCGPGAIVSKNAWRDIRRLLTANAASGATTVSVGETAGVANGHTLVLQTDDGVFVNGTVTGVSPTTISFTPALASQSSIGAGWRNASDVVNNVSIRGIRVLGDQSSVDLAPYVNIAPSQTRTSAGNLALTGSLTMGGVAYLTPNSNLPLRVCNTATNAGVTLTVSGTKVMSDYSRVAASEAVSLAVAGCRLTQARFNRVTQAALSAALSGAASVGAADGPESGNGITLSTPFFSLRDVLIQRTKGVGLRSDWTAGGGGFASQYAAVQGEIDGIDVSLTQGACMWINGPNDNKITKPICGFTNYDYGIWIDRNSGGTDVAQAHVAGANDGTGFRQPLHGVVVDADTVALTDVKSEEALKTQLLVRANNLTVTSGNYFAPFVPNGQQPSCIQIADPDYNVNAILAYSIRTRVQDCQGNAIYFTPGLDGGWGNVHIIGYDFQTTLASSAASGATAVQFACGACTAKLVQGMNVVLSLDSGVQSIALGAYNSGANTWAVTALTGTAASGKVLYRARSAGGSPLTTGLRSDINVYIPMGAYPPSFVQAH